MAEYISREEAINAIKSLESSMPAKDNYAKGYDAALGRVLIAVREVPPAADVQPINPWISVDEALPIYEGLVLVADKNSTIRLGMYTDLGWTSQFGNPMVAHITHWQPLPEPPKAGDAK